MPQDSSYKNINATVRTPRCAILINAIHAAAEHGAYIRAAFEVYRFDLLARLRIPPPTNLIEERQLWSELYGLIVGRVAPPWVYDHGASNLQSQA